MMHERQRAAVRSGIEKIVRSFEGIVTDQHPKVVQAGIRALEALIRAHPEQMEAQLEWTLPKVFGKTMAPKPQTRECALSLLQWCVSLRKESTTRTFWRARRERSGGRLVAERKGCTRALNLAHSRSPPHPARAQRPANVLARCHRPRAGQGARQ